MSSCANECGRPAEPQTGLGRPPVCCGEKCREERKVKLNAKYRVAHKAHRAVYNAKWAAENRDRRAANQSKNRASRSIKEHRRRARQRGARSAPYTRLGIWEREEGLCGLCGLPADPHDWHLDHAIPLGPGDDTPENVQVAHPLCNLRKNLEDKRMLAEWRRLLR